MELLQSNGVDFFHYYASNTKHRPPQYRYAIKWVRDFQKGKELYLHDISQDWVIGFKRFLLDKLAHNTASNYFIRVKSIVNLAYKEGVIFTNPFDKISLNIRRTPSESITQEEIDKLYSKLNEYKGKKLQVLKMFLLALETGLRISDIKRIRQENIKGRHLSLFQKKNGIFVNNYLTDNALMLLSGGIPSVKVSHERLYFFMREIQRENGITSKSKFHLARHTFANTHVELGTPIPVLQQLMGHSNISSTMWYVNPTQEAKDKAMERFNKR